MAMELEDRLSALEKELAEAKKTPLVHHGKPLHTRKSKWIIGTLVVLLIGAGIAAFLIYRHRAIIASPIPAAISKQVTFDLFYPNPLPAGFTFDPRSLSYDGSAMVSYILQSGDKRISIIEQPLPNNNLHLESAVGLNAIDSPSGKAYVGKDKAIPVGIVTTPKTLVNISGTLDVSDNTISSTVQNLKLTRK
jgi:hypothetical protein